MKNNKGFVVSAVLYPLLVLFLALIMGLLAMTDTRKRILDKMKLEISDSIFDEATCSCDTILNKLNYIIKNGVAGGGGGGGSYTYNVLGVNVKAYDAPASMPNVGNGIGDIAVITDVEIANYYVAKTAPRDPKEGTVWIVQDRNSEYYIESDYSKIGVSYVMQYIDSTWVLKKAYVYKEMRWVLLYYVPVSNGEIDLSGTDLNAKIIHTYSFTGEYQTFSPTFSGIYKIELWGAQGGTYKSSIGGNGAYTSGEIYLDAGQELYIYVGEKGEDGKAGMAKGGWNGGGSTGSTSSDYSGGGGGATDVRLVSTTEKNAWNEFDSLKSRIMVAAGGGGSGFYSSATSVGLGGYGGGLKGYQAGYGYASPNGGYKKLPLGATQTYGGTGYISTDSSSPEGNHGTFGIAGNAPSLYGGGGGGGYYGGGSGSWSSSLVSGGSGGSSYISGFAGSNSISEKSTAIDIIHTGSMYHYSDFFFTNTEMIDGNGKKWDDMFVSTKNQPTFDGKGTQIGNSGNGYAKVTLLQVGVEIGKEKSEYENSYSLSKTPQEFIVPLNGTYKVELWGAQGDSKNSVIGGKGAYTAGEIYLTKGSKFYVYVGESGNTLGKTSFNGGNSGGPEFGTGGGATDIRLTRSNDWTAFSSLKSRIMVAAGGGGTSWFSSSTTGASSGHGGGLIGYNGLYNYSSPNAGYIALASGGEQATGGKGWITKVGGKNGQDGTFGVGASGHSSYGGGGGGGYYGGGGGDASNSITGQGGGGSSYISGHYGCNSIEESSTSDDIIHNGSSYHYSGYYFDKTRMIDGNGHEWINEEVGNIVNMPAYDSSSIVTGNTGDGYAKITLIREEEKPMATPENKAYSYSLSPNYQIFRVQNSGNYKIELWGSQGGTYSTVGGKGAYATGEIYLTKGTVLYIFVGESGLRKVSTTFNGGGAGQISRDTTSISKYEASGGGATDIRTIVTADPSEWSNRNSLNSRIMVAAGGAGAGWYSGANAQVSSGHAGGLIGYEGGYTYSSGNAGYTKLAQGGNQTQGGTGWMYKTTGQNGNAGLFGMGGSASNLNYGGGGGSGWYGGGSGSWSNGIVSQGGGGSSYISGHAGCIAVNSSGNPVKSAYSTLSDSISYTGYKFINTSMVDGNGYKWSTEKLTNINMPTHNGKSTMVGNEGDGYAKITYLGA